MSWHCCTNNHFTRCLPPWLPFPVPFWPVCCLCLLISGICCSYFCWKSSCVPRDYSNRILAATWQQFTYRPFTSICVDKISQTCTQFLFFKVNLDGLNVKTAHILGSASTAPVPLLMLTDFQTLIITFSVKNNARSTACQLGKDLYLTPWLFWNFSLY